MRTHPVLLGLLAVSCAVAACAAGAFGPWVDASAAAPSTTVPPPPGQPVPPTVALDPTNGLPAAQGPLVVLGAGCVAPSNPLAVFEGVVVDAVATTARFQVTRLLAGSLQGYEIGERVDVRYGDETRFLAVGDTYVVCAGASAVDGALVSTVREPSPLFGGDAVVGLNDNDVDCPTIDDPVRTVLPDGSSVDTGVLAPLRGNGKSLLGAVLRPVGVALLVLLALVLVKHLVFALGRGLRDLSSPSPVERTRQHEPR
jgi:hypothetical protein